MGVAFGVAAVAAAVVAVGLVVAAVLGALVLRSGASDLGAGMGRAYGEASNEALGGALGGSWGAYPPGPVEQTAPVPPGVLGPDPVLDAYAQECFAGDLQSCDDLYAESVPLSDYEEYAGTCGGRVKELTVPFCTELD